jgi:hypothetical protein
MASGSGGETDSGIVIPKAGADVMELFDQRGMTISNLVDGLALGIDMFGDYATLLWVMPLLWIIAGSLIWMHVIIGDRHRNRSYLAYAAHNLPQFRHLAKQRSIEVLHVRGDERNRRQ